MAATQLVNNKKNEVIPTGKFVWFDFAIKNEATAIPFFKSVLAWDCVPSGPNYWEIRVNGEMVGGLRKETTNFKPIVGFTPYFCVPSITEAKSLVQTYGGRLQGETIAISEGTMGYYQNFHDVDGNTLSLWSMKK